MDRISQRGVQLDCQLVLPSRANHSVHLARWKKDNEYDFAITRGWRQPIKEEIQKNRAIRLWFFRVRDRVTILNNATLLEEPPSRQHSDDEAPLPNVEPATEEYC